MDNLKGFMQDEALLELSKAEQIFAADGESLLLNDEGDCCFLYIKRGSCTAVYREKEYEFIQSMTYIWENKKEVMVLSGRKEDFAAVHFVIKNGVLLRNFAGSEDSTVLCSRTSPKDTRLLACLLDYISKKQSYPSYMEELIRNKILWICVLLLSKSRETEEGYKKVNELAEKMKQYIEENYQKNMSLDSIGRHFCITVDYVSHVFKDYYGISPIKYLINVRIRTAKWLLMNTMDSVNEISYKVGYENQAYFSTLFRKEVGVSPVNFRLEFRRIV